MTIHNRRDRRGQGLIEVAFSIPFLLLIIANVVNFGGLFYCTITVANAARQGSQYWVLGGASLGSPRLPQPSEVHNLITRDTLPLLNPSSLIVRTCVQIKQAGGGSTADCNVFPGGGSFSDPAWDVRPEAPFHVMSWVDVQYTYQPYIPLFDVPLLGLPLTPPAQTINRQSIMRSLN